MGTLQLDDADESRLQIVVITGVAQVQGMGLQRGRERQVREALGAGESCEGRALLPCSGQVPRQVLGARKGWAFSLVGVILNS